MLEYVPEEHRPQDELSTDFQDLCIRKCCEKSKIDPNYSHCTSSILWTLNCHGLHQRDFSTIQQDIRNRKWTLTQKVNFSAPYAMIYDSIHGRTGLHSRLGRVSEQTT